jgi:beta-lactamase regulating signal transducer with metallopeptidase domain
MINYIIQVMLFQALFLAVYDFFLQKETFFKWNRVYLLVTPLVAFVIPLVKLQSVQQVIPQKYILELPTVVINPQDVIEQSVQNISSVNYTQLLFFVGVVVFSVVFIWKLKTIISLINSNKIVKEQDVNLVLVNEKQSAFSFFNYIFIHPSFLNKKDLKIIQHEIIHCKHYHTLDLLIFELLRIAMWFNPFIYVYQNRIKVLHEYISDAEVLKETDKHQYFNQLLTETFSVEKFSFINQFYKHSLIKKRIVMITKNKSQKFKQLKYLLVVPLLLGMLIYSACTSESQFDPIEIEHTLKQEIPSEGKYYDAKFGKLFIGSSLEGKEVPMSEYSLKEKEASNFISNKEGGLEFKIVIDKNNNRVAFIKVPLPPPPPKQTKSIDYSNADEVPFTVIDEVPIYPGCEGTKEELKKCFQEKLSQHIAKEFNAGLAKELKLEPGGNRIIVLFEIDKEGKISDVKARAPHPNLEAEAIRAIKTLPAFEPGKHLGKAVKVKYSLPIAFKVE